jgi:hypothetical protein
VARRGTRLEVSGDAVWRGVPCRGTVAWQVDYKDLKGKRRHKQFNKRHKADEWLVGARAEIAEGTHVAASDTITFRQAGESWIANCRRRRLEETTIISYRQHLDDRLYPLWQDKKLNELAKPVAQTIYEDLLDRNPRLAHARFRFHKSSAMLLPLGSRSALPAN